MFYAEFCPYGIHTISDGDTLMAFETREERNEMAERINDARSERVEGCAVAVTTREKFPDTDSIERHVGPLRQG